MITASFEVTITPAFLHRSTGLWWEHYGGWWHSMVGDVRFALTRLGDEYRLTSICEERTTILPWAFVDTRTPLADIFQSLLADILSHREVK